MGSLENTFPSSVIWKDDPKYEQARVGRVFNHRRPDRYPRAVIEATSVKDIVDAVLLARELNTRVSVRSGGHSWAAVSIHNFYVTTYVLMYGSGLFEKMLFSLTWGNSSA